jgi:glycosyl transferase family 92
MVKIFLVLMIGLAGFGFTKPKKHELSVCAIFKNEKKYLKEWIEYHRMIGIDHFYLYNNNSSDRPLTILLPYIKQGVVTLISWPDALPEEKEENSAMWALSTQVSAYENAIQTRAKKESEWLVLMSVDEFLVPGEQTSLKTLLKQNERVPGIILQEECYDAEDGSLASHQLLIEVKDRIASNVPVCTEVEKMVFRPDLCEYFTWPPYKYIFKDKLEPLKVAKQNLRINRYLNRFKNRLFFGPTKQKISLDPKLLSDEEVEELLEQGYTMEDQEGVISRFIPKMKKVMGLAN